jgi:hypothetical protein
MPEAPEMTFFDHLRLKKLGGQLDSPFGGAGGPAPASLPRSPAPASVSFSAPAPQPEAGLGQRRGPATGQALRQPEAAASLRKAALGGGARDRHRRVPGTEASPGLETAREAEGTERKEPRLLLGVKWLAKFMLSALILAWIFFLGVLVGRGTLLNSSDAPKDASALQAGAYDARGSAPPEGPAETNGAGAETDPAYLATDPTSGRPLPIPSPYGGEPVYLGGNEGSSAYAYIPPPEEEDYPDSPAPGIPPAGGAQLSPQGTPRPDTAPSAASAPSPAAAPAETPAAAAANAPAAGSDVASAAAKAPAAVAAKAPAPAASAKATAAAPADQDPVATLMARRQEAAATKDKPAEAKASQAPSDETVYWPQAPAGTGQYTVQVASPTSEAEARTVTERYRKRGFDAYYYATGKGRFPTRVGRYRTAEEAGEYLAKLKEAGAKGPYVSRLNQ